MYNQNETMYSGNKLYNHCKAWEQCLVDSENRINAWAVGMSSDEIESFCKKYHCRIAYYDTDTETIKG